MDILQSGLIQSEDEFRELSQRCGQVIVPNDDDLDVTHWWVLNDGGVRVLYVGTPETFTEWIKETNGGIQ